MSPRLRRTLLGLKSTNMMFSVLDTNLIITDIHTAKINTKHNKKFQIKSVQLEMTLDSDSVPKTKK